MIFPYKECLRCDNLDYDWFGLACMVESNEERKPDGECCRFFEPKENKKQEKEQG